MKYKPGDKVRIKDDNWYWSNCDILGNIECGEWHFLPEHREYCGKVLTIVDALKDSYLMENVGGRWTDEMIERLADEPQEKMVSLDKVCEWLKNTIDDDVLVKCGSVIKCMDVNDFVSYFSKTMEE